MLLFDVFDVFPKIDLEIFATVYVRCRHLLTAIDVGHKNRTNVTELCRRGTEAEKRLRKRLVENRDWWVNHRGSYVMIPPVDPSRGSEINVCSPLVGNPSLPKLSQEAERAVEEFSKLFEQHVSLPSYFRMPNGRCYSGPISRGFPIYRSYAERRADLTRPLPLVKKSYYFQGGLFAKNSKLCEQAHKDMSCNLPLPYVILTVINTPGIDIKHFISEYNLTGNLYQSWVTARGLELGIPFMFHKMAWMSSSLRGYRLQRPNQRRVFAYEMGRRGRRRRNEHTRQ